MSLFYITVFETILAALFRTISLPLLFLSSKSSFLDDHFTTQDSDFAVFFKQLFSTDKQVNRSKLAYASMLLNVFAFRGFFLS